MIVPTTVKGQAMSTTAKVPPAKLARVVEWARHHLIISINGWYLHRQR